MAVTARTLLRRGFGAAAWTLAALAFTAPVRASDGDDALAKMQAAVRSARSFTARFEPLLVMSWVIVQPDRIRRRSYIAEGVQTEDWIVIGRRSYTHVGDKPWTIGSETVDGIRWGEVAPFLRDGTTATALADRVEDGTPVGALDVAFAPDIRTDPSIRPFHWTCSYDKGTYLPRACSYKVFGPMRVTMTYEHWNDPANAVEAPPEVHT